MTTAVECSCGAVELKITGKAILQYVCHCDDCQAVHGKAYSCSLYPASAISIVRGETDAFTLRTAPRTKCKQCGTYLFAEVPGHPEFHSQCGYAAAPVRDELPHYKGTPVRFGGSDQLMEW
jgi:hypothetical protein